MWNPFRRKPTPQPSNPIALQPGPAGDVDALQFALSGEAEERRRDAEQVSYRQDGWINEVMALGTARDKGAWTQFRGDPVVDEEARELWLYEDLAATIIELIVDDAYRNGFSIDVPDDKEEGEAIHQGVLDLKWGDKSGIDALQMARKMERAYGGSAIYPIANDGASDLSTPINWDRIGEIESLVLLEPRELQAAAWYDEMTDVKFRMPKIYRCRPYVPFGAMTSELIHESRLIICPGIRIGGRNIPGRYPGWGDSVLTRVKAVLQQFNLSFSAAQALINDFAQAIFKMKGLAQALAIDAREGTDNGRRSLRKRIGELDFTRSVNRIAPIDADDSLTREATPVAGLSDLLDKFILRLAASAHMPATKLMGQSPAGMDATGESDQDNWDDQVKSEQSSNNTVPAKKLAYFVIRAKNGPTKGKEPKKWGLTWAPLRQATAKEQAEERYLVAQADEIYTQKIGAVSADELAQSRWGGGRYSPDMHIDFEERARLQAESDRAAAEAAAQMPPQPVDQSPQFGDAPATAPADGVVQEPAEGVAGGGAAGVKRVPVTQHQRKAGAVPVKGHDRAAPQIRRGDARMPARYRYDAIEIAADSSGGVMIALFVPSDVAEDIAIKGGEAAEDLHVTLAYLGRDLPEIAVTRAIGIAYDLSMQMAPIEATLSGIGRFSASETSQGKDVLYATVDSPQLVELREHLCRRLAWDNVPVSKEHGFTPHVTLAYLEPKARAPLDHFEPVDVEFSILCVASGDKQVTFPFVGKPSDDEESASLKAVG